MKTIELDRINRTDTRFCVSYPFEDPLLLASITRYGIRVPLVLLDTTPHTVVTGFKRLDVARRLGLSAVPCCVSHMGDKDALLTAINDNIKRPLNIVERALVLQRMTELGFSQDELHAMIKLLGYEPHEKILRHLLALASADHETKTFIIKQSASITLIELLLAFDDADRKKIVSLLTSLHPTFGQLREILQSLLLLKVKANRLPWDELSTVITADQLKLRLKKRTHPVLSALEERLKETRAKAALPSQVTVNVDPFFERESIDILIKAKHVTDVEEAVRGLERLIKDGWIGEILELTDGTYRN